MTAEQLDRFAAFGDQAVGHAERMIRDRYGRVEAHSKGRFDLVTAADLAVEDWFAGELARAFPDHGLIAEEGAGSGRGAGSEFCWVLDPLDGTVNFAGGVPFFAVSLALLFEGAPLLGWVGDPCHGEVFRARRGGGATLNGRTLACQPVRGRTPPVGISSGLVQWVLEHNQADLLATVLERVGKFRKFGSQALALCYVAAGRLGANISREAKLWDDAAGALIAMECGCRYSDLAGADVFPLTGEDSRWRGHSRGSLAGEPELHRELTQLLSPQAAGRAG